MWTRTIISGTSEYLQPRDVCRETLKRLIENNTPYAWAHFEYRKSTHWLRNLFTGNSPFLEVTLPEKGVIEINTGIPQKISDPVALFLSKGIVVPLDWGVTGKGGLFRAPVASMNTLPDWIETFFIKVHGCPSDYRLAGWLEGV